MQEIGENNEYTRFLKLFMKYGGHTPVDPSIIPQSREAVG